MVELRRQRQDWWSSSWDLNTKTAEQEDRLRCAVSWYGHVTNETYALIQRYETHRHHFHLTKKIRYQICQWKESVMSCCYKKILFFWLYLAIFSFFYFLFTSKCTIILQKYISQHGPGSSVGIATELRAGQSRDRIQVGRDFPPVQTGPGAHPGPCTMGIGSFPGVKYGRGVPLTTHPLLVLRSWKSRAILYPTPVPHQVL